MSLKESERLEFTIFWKNASSAPYKRSFQVYCTDCLVFELNYAFLLLFLFIFFTFLQVNPTPELSKDYFSVQVKLYIKYITN